MIKSINQQSKTAPRKHYQAVERVINVVQNNYGDQKSHWDGHQ
jgi:hypothetical protein